jgi:glycogen debranching enzyme
VDDVIRVHDRYYILATSGLSDDRTRVLKHGDTFAVFDRHGDVQPIGLGQQGVFDRGTRGLSRFDVRVAGTRPLLLSSTLDRENALLLVSSTNPDLQRDGRVDVPRNTVHIERASVVLDGGCYTRLTLRNFEREPVDLVLAVGFEADFADVFEVRGVVRARRGTLHEPRVEDGRVVLGYTGLDRVDRCTVITFDRPTTSLTASRAEFSVHLAPAGRTDLEIGVDCRSESGNGAGPRRLTFDDAVHATRASMLRLTQEECTVRTSSAAFNDWITRSTADLAMMTTQTDAGPFPYAGVPWFCTPFGRDGIITALELLWAKPSLARGVLRFLAATQATETRPEADAEPGKIVHEMRAGEMAALREIPFARYYGSVDATPLFVMLAAAYHARTGDDALVRELWPNVTRALDWMGREGDVDGDGFVEYARRSRDGLQNQGWKDSEDSVFHADGTLAEGPIALCEVQAYVYGAKRGAARLAGIVGERDRARALVAEARTLRARFEAAFWCDDLATYALALDGDKRPCRVRSSNAGHCLYTGIASPTRARLVAGTLTHPDMYSGWGIRTVACGERRYNPMSYHNGSVWPHDNALIAAGMARHHLGHHAEKLMQGWFDTCQWVDLQRLPELVCGFGRMPGAGPTLYPVACAPQSWAAGAVYLLLSSALGLTIDGPEQRIRFTYPRLPGFLETVWITGLRVGHAHVDLELRRHGDDVGVNVLRRDGAVEVVLVK